MCAVHAFVKEHTGYDISGMDEDALRGVCRELGIETDPSMGKGKLIDASRICSTKRSYWSNGSLSSE